MYYAQGETMEVIAHHLGVSRSTVSRLLARARDEGVVRIELREPGAAGSLERRFLDEYGVRARIVHVREGATEIHRLQQVAAVAATTLTEMIDAEATQTAVGSSGSTAVGSTGPSGPTAVGSSGSTAVGSHGPAAVGHEAAPTTDGGFVVGVAWGTTMGELSAALPTRRVPGLTLVQLNGASDPLREGPSAGDVLSRMGQSLGARTIAFPVPAFFDQVATRRAMWSERSVKRVLAVASRARIAVFGVGSLSSDLPSQVYSGGHLTRVDLAVVHREEVVGDVCTVLLRADGTWRDIDLNARATGPTPAQLARIPRRLCVVAGTGKARAALAALRARVATDLVVDDATARAVLALSHRKDRT
ncbi:MULTISPECIES: sugar-binding transcriptional regulator [Actinomyces]|uniref:Helix-turn-helix domain-containing protein n=1 Tax=Actinomyces respiraculi TaxID=2744574 RepID=A0A7T0PYI3_9ACTO|nr:MULTISPECIES: sugar-binding domain-containing protein [Actinomyces]QPL06685.1 helix-turn-helix domain-containing protein [Actinomyces respiraculi]